MPEEPQRPMPTPWGFVAVASAVPTSNGQGESPETTVPRALKALPAGVSQVLNHQRGQELRHPLQCSGCSVLTVEAHASTHLSGADQQNFEGMCVSDPHVWSRTTLWAIFLLMSVMIDMSQACDIVASSPPDPRFDAYALYSEF
eukprot:324182-Amphidinium_carterae.1